MDWLACMSIDCHQHVEAIDPAHGSDAFCLTHNQPSCNIPGQGPDGKWNQYTGRYAWDASCIVSNQREEFGGTGALKKEALFGAAPNMDHSNVSSCSYCFCLKL
jgi:hypothetical protein